MKHEEISFRLVCKKGTAQGFRLFHIAKWADEANAFMFTVGSYMNNFNHLFTQSQYYAENSSSDLYRSKTLTIRASGGMSST